MRNKAPQNPVKKARKVERAKPRKRRSTARPKTEQKIETPYDRIKHLLGILDGPGDLTTNPKYWEDFGT
jgi:hypothetical protein